MTEATLLFIYGETALHPGTGASLGSIDLPVQRERTTQYPLIQGSSVKGVLRATASLQPSKEAEINLLFGHEKQEYAGALAFSDAKILLFPVRSIAGVFAWITCPALLARLRRDLSVTGQTTDWEASYDFDEKNSSKAYVPTNADTLAQDKIVLEEYLFTPKKDTKVEKLAKWLAANAFPTAAEFDWWRTKIQKSLIVLSDNDFRDFVTTATEIVARVKIDSKTKTVETGALWYQEFLPPETLFYSVLLAQAGRNKTATSAGDVLKSFKNLKLDRAQLGGDETTGKGLCQLRTL